MSSQVCAPRRAAPLRAPPSPRAARTAAPAAGNEIGQHRELGRLWHGRHAESVVHSRACAGAGGGGRWVAGKGDAVADGRSMLRLQLQVVRSRVRKHEPSGGAPWRMPGLTGVRHFAARHAAFYEPFQQTFHSSSPAFRIARAANFTRASFADTCVRVRLRPCALSPAFAFV